MKKSFTKPVILFSGIVFLSGIIFGIIGSIMGGNAFRASANIDRLIGDNAIIKFEFATPEPTAVPYYGGGDMFGGSDIFDIFEEFGLEEEFGDFFSPYDGGYDTAPGGSGKIYY